MRVAKVGWGFLLAICLGAAGAGCPRSTNTDGGGNEGGVDAMGVDGGADAVGADAVIDTGTPGPFGAVCTTDAQCESGLCLSSGHCSRSCAGAADCPASANWMCVSLPGRGTACDCTPRGTSDAPCNMIDDECNGLVDDTSRMCPAGCVDVSSDSNNCGGCGITCGGGTTCQSGHCECPPARSTVCGTRCADTMTDPMNCGACGNVCPGGTSGMASCAAGRCGVMCTPGSGDCDGNAANGCETNTRSDITNCGTCGNTCAYAHATATCSTGSCVLGACAAGFSNCDGDPTNGCETETASNAMHCGMCGHACVPPHGIGACTAGACDLAACNPGYANCDTVAANGCEISTPTDPLNCGTCGHICPGTTAPFTIAGCAAGVCSSTCVAGYGDCDGSVANGCETSTAANPNNCGACGTVCPAGQQCVTGTCRTSVPVDVIILLDLTGSNTTGISSYVPMFPTRLVAPLLAIPDVNVGVAYTTEFPNTPYGSTGDRPFQGAAEPSTIATTINNALTSRMAAGGGDASDAMIEGLAPLMGLPVHPLSLAMTCSAGRVAGGCWRPGARRVVVLFTDDIFHNGPDPSLAVTTLYDPYAGITPAPAVWPDVLAAMRSQGTVLLFMNSNTTSGSASPGQPQYVRMLSELGQPVTDVFLSNTAGSTGTACDAVVARVQAIHGP